MKDFADSKVHGQARRGHADPGIGSIDSMMIAPVIRTRMHRSRVVHPRSSRRLQATSVASPN
jgi:hypothetical protein